MKILHIMNGGQAIESYMQTIIASSESLISPEISSIIFGVIQFPAGKFPLKNTTTSRSLKTGHLSL